MRVSASLRAFVVAVDYPQGKPFGPTGKGFAIGPDKMAADAQFDGVFVLRPNTTLPALTVVLRYRILLAAEQSFLAAKTLLATRPVSTASR
jgi:hypothetical protein